MSGLKRWAWLRVILLVLLAAVPWTIINFTYAIPFWNYGWDYHVHSLSHGLNIDKAISDGEYRFVDYFQTVHPGIPFQITSWLCYRAASLGQGTDFIDRAERVLSDPSAFWRSSQTVTLVITMVAGLWLAWKGKSLGFGFSLALFWVCFAYVPFWEFGLSYLGNETFALPLAILLFGLAERVLTQHHPPLRSWAAVGAAGGLAYLNKLNYVVWTSAIVVGLFVHCLSRRGNIRRTALDLGSLCIGFLAIIASVGGASLGLKGLEQMLLHHYAIVTHTGQFAQGATGLISVERVSEALARLTAFKGFLIALAASILVAAIVVFRQRRNSVFLNREVPYLTCLLGALGLTFAAALKHFDEHYLVPAAAILAPLLLWIGQQVGPRVRRAAVALVALLAVLSFHRYLDYRVERMTAGQVWVREAQGVRELPIEAGQLRLWSYRAAVPEYMSSFTTDLAGIAIFRNMLLRHYPQDRMYSVWTRKVYTRTGLADPNTLPWRYAIFDRSQYASPSSLPESFQQEAGEIHQRQNLWIAERADAPAPSAESVCLQCQIDFTAGWYPREGSGNDWWFWAEKQGEITLWAPHAMSVELQAQFMSMSLPNTIDVILNGKLEREWPVQASFALPLPVRSGRNTLELVSREPAVKPPHDSRLLGIGVRNLVVVDAETGKTFPDQ